jgi:phage shock protein C
LEWAVLPTGPAITSTDRDNQPYSWDGTILDNPKSEKSVMILGGVLVAFGIIMLVDDFPFWYQIKKYFWPVALIAIGAFIILRQRDKKVENESTGYTPTEPPVKPVEPDPYTPYSTVKPENTHSTDPEVKRKDDEDDQIIRVN